MRGVRHGVLAGAISTAIGCGGSTVAPTTPVTATLHGEVVDAIGDARADPRVPVAPDLVRATIDVAAGSMTLVVTLAPGTLDRHTTRVSVLLDTDQNGSTGILQSSGLGADYALDLDAATGQAAVTKANPVGCAAHQSCFDPISLTPITFLTDAMQIVLPLTTLGNTDGHMAFQMDAYVLVAPLTAVVFDFMPDTGVGRVQ